MSEAIEKPDESEPLTDRQIAYIEHIKDPDFVERLVTQSEIAKMFNVAPKTIWRMRTKSHKLPPYDEDFSGRMAGWWRSTLLLRGMPIPARLASQPKPEEAPDEHQDN